jgi:hypothetical protein
MDHDQGRRRHLHQIPGILHHDKLI